MRLILVCRFSLESIKRKVIKQIVSNTDLTSGANFGLIEWGSPNRLRLLVPISDNGASRIYNSVGRVAARGGTDLNYALNFARRYYTGQTQYGSVPNYGQDCAQNYIIVINLIRFTCTYYYSCNTLIS